MLRVLVLIRPGDGAAANLQVDGTGSAVERCAMSVQAVRVQRLRHTEPIEEAADAVDAEAPEWTFAILAHQLMESAQLVCSSRVELELASFPARKGVRCDLQEASRLGLRQAAQRTSQVHQIQIRAAGPHRSIRHV